LFIIPFSYEKNDCGSRKTQSLRNGISLLSELLLTAGALLLHPEPIIALETPVSLIINEIALNIYIYTKNYFGIKAVG